MRNGSAQRLLDALRRAHRVGLALDLSISIANSSPPRRATVSLARSIDVRRCADADQQLVAERVAEASR